MKQCSICGYLFEPDESKPLRCPRCGVTFHKSSPSENSPQPSSESGQPVPTSAEASPATEQAGAEQAAPTAETPKPDGWEEAVSFAPSQWEQTAPDRSPGPDASPTEQEAAKTNLETATPVPPEGSQPSPGENQKRKRQWPKVLGLMVLLLLVAVCSFFLGVGQRDFFGQDHASTSSTLSIPSSTGEYYDPQGVSPEEFARLQTGMTYAQISGIIGGDAYQTTVPDVSGSYSAAWQGQEDPQAVLTVRFVDGLAVDLQQSGLDPTQSQTSETSQDQ